MGKSARLLALLNQIGLQQKDPKFYQYLKSLLDNLGDAEDSIAVIISGGGGGSVVNNINNYHQFLDLLNDDSSDDGISIPGPAGANGSTGSAGAQGQSGPALYLANDEYVESTDIMQLVYNVISGGGSVTSIADDSIYTAVSPDPIVATGTIGLTELSKSAIDSSLHTLLGGI